MLLEEEKKEAIDILQQEEDCPHCFGQMVQTGNGSFTSETYAVEWRCKKCKSFWIEVYNGKHSTFYPTEGGHCYE